MKNDSTPVSRVRFNINDYVRVRLTDAGRGWHRQHHDELVRDIKARTGRCTLEYTPPREDADGWSRWQLWSLMQEFGPHITMGFLPPFDVEIQIEVGKDAR